MTELKYGTVLWFNNKKSYGFISTEEDEQDWFVHYTQIVGEPGQFKSLTAGQRVSFVIGANDRGPQAEQVTVIAEPEE